MSGVVVNDNNHVSSVGVDGATAYMKLDTSNVLSVNDGNVIVNGNLMVKQEGQEPVDVVTLVFKSVYPVGSLYITMNEIPGEKTIDGTSFTVNWMGCKWLYMNQERFLRNAKCTISGETVTLSASGATGGNATHTHGLTPGTAYAQIALFPSWREVRYTEFTVPGWNSDYWVKTDSGGGTGDGEGTDVGGGVGGSTNSSSSLPPYVDCYMYKRIE